MKKTIPDLDEPIEHIKYIGYHLTAALYNEGIFTCRHLLKKLEYMGRKNEDRKKARLRTKIWLEKVTKNKRAFECIAMRVSGIKRSYKIRESNKFGFNALIKVMRAYATEPSRGWVPYQKKQRKVALDC